MADFKLGFVTIHLPDATELPPQAGKLTTDERRRLPKARRSVGAVALATADDLERAGDRLRVQGVTPEALRAAGARADLFEPIITDLHLALQIMTDANTIVDSEAHKLLLDVLAQIRAQEKVDPSAPGHVPSLVQYHK